MKKLFNELKDYSYYSNDFESSIEPKEVGFNTTIQKWKGPNAKKILIQKYKSPLAKYFIFKNIKIFVGSLSPQKLSFLPFNC